MFKWNKEELRFKNMPVSPFGTLKTTFEDLASSLSFEDKFDFLDQGHDFKLTEIKRIVDNYRASSSSIKCDCSGNPKTVSLKAWIKKNDPMHLFDIDYRVGNTKGFYPDAYLQDLALINDVEGVGDRFENWINALFVETCFKLRKEEVDYFNSTDPYEIAKTQLKNFSNKYHTTFGTHLGFCSNGDIYIYEDTDTREDVKKRCITLEEISSLLNKYRLLEKLDLILTSGADCTELQFVADRMIEVNQIITKEE